MLNFDFMRFYEFFKLCVFSTMWRPQRPSADTCHLYLSVNSHLHANNELPLEISITANVGPRPSVAGKGGETRTGLTFIDFTGIV